MEASSYYCYCQLGCRGGNDVCPIKILDTYNPDQYALIGSTEWGEDFADWIDAHVVAYFNLGEDFLFWHQAKLTCHIDVSVSGSQFVAAGSPLLAHFIRNAARDIPHPTDANRTLWDARNDDGPFTGPPSKINSGVVNITQFEAEDDLELVPLGSGSDFTVFLQRNSVSMSLDTFSPSPS
jgi:N-acetylated-alpha-linked acidic dipeptidase